MGRLQIADVTFEVRDEGRGPPLVLLHGFPSTHQLWDGVIPPLCAAGFRCIAPDLAGYGLSEAPSGGDNGMERQAGWLTLLLDSLGVDHPILVAHDVGSAAAEILVADQPSRAEALIVMDGVYSDQWAMEWVESIRSWDPGNAARLMPVLARRLRIPGREEAVRAMLAPYEGARGGLRLIAAAQALDPRQTATRLEALRAARVPALVLWGEADRYLPIETVARPLAALLKAELHLLPGGHFLPLESPDEVAAEIVRFARAR